MKRRPVRHAVFAAVVVVSGCSVASDNSPRDIDAGALALAPQDPSNVGQAAAGTGRIYLVAPSVPGEPSRLQAVSRDIDDDPGAVMAALLAGPNTTEFVDRRYRTNLPAEMAVLSVTPRSRGIVELNVNDAIVALRGDELILALAQIVYTLNDVNGVNGVTITVDGEPSRWPASNGELQADALTVYDFPGVEPSTQPAYPAVPSDE